MFFKKLVLVMAATILVTACASPTVVQTVRPDDELLSCEKLREEFTQTDQLRDAAIREKGVTGGNVVRALLFWPAILGTAENANEAISAADARKVRLANQMSLKDCANEKSLLTSSPPSVLRLLRERRKGEDSHNWTAMPGRGF